MTVIRHLSREELEQGLADILASPQDNGRLGLVAVSSDRRQLAGDQLYLDLDLGRENLPPGTRLAVGSAVIEVTAAPHTGCRKFADRFGREAMVFVNSGIGRERNLRGINARIVVSGDVRIGDVARKLS